MEKFGQWINEFSNTKLGMIIGITISVLLVLAYIFSKTSIGRKALIELRAKATTTKSYADTTRKNVEEQLEKQREEAEKQLALYEQYFNEFRQETFEVLKLIPNAKVKKFVKDHENIDLKELVKEQLNRSQNG